MASEPRTEKRHLLPGTAPLAELTEQLHERREACHGEGAGTGHLSPRVPSLSIGLLGKYISRSHTSNKHP